jgi:hypothetical protein
LYPVFRGKNLDLPNFEGTIVSEITLIGNKKESFELLIDAIVVE